MALSNHPSSFLVGNTSPRLDSYSVGIELDMKAWHKAPPALPPYALEALLVMLVGAGTAPASAAAAAAAAAAAVGVHANRGVLSTVAIFLSRVPSCRRVSLTRHVQKERRRTPVVSRRRGLLLLPAASTQKRVTILPAARAAAEVSRLSS